MSTPLTLSPARGQDGRAVLAAVGEIDMSNSDAFAAALETALDTVREAGGRLVVDLSGIEYLDSAGLSVLFAHAGRIEVTANQLLGPVLTTSGLADITTVHGLDGPAGGER